MQAVEKRVVIVLADISGYTRFMVENQMSAIHGQQYITFLIETLLREVNIPLRLQEIEGDALFLYAEDPGSDGDWQRMLAQIPAMLSRFFDAFYEGIVLGLEATPCKCAVCSHGKELALKIVVHSGHAVFHQIGGFNKVSGPDVILAHRLLKNSVPDKEYLLMSEAAWSDFGHLMQGPFLIGTETYEGFGSINTVVRFNGDIREQHLDSLYRLPRTSLMLRAQAYSVSAVAGMFPALAKQLVSPKPDKGRTWWWHFAVKLVLLTPLIMLKYMINAPRRLLARRAVHHYMPVGDVEST